MVSSIEEFKVLPSSLEVDEVIACFQTRWDASYDMKLIVRNKRLYLHIMWAYLEQQSFPLDEAEYRLHIAEIVEVRIFIVNNFREFVSNFLLKESFLEDVSFFYFVENSF